MRLTEMNPIWRGWDSLPVARPAFAASFGLPNGSSDLSRLLPPWRLHGKSQRAGDID